MAFPGITSNAALAALATRAETPTCSDCMKQNFPSFAPIASIIDRLATVGEIDFEGSQGWDVAPPEQRDLDRKIDTIDLRYYPYNCAYVHRCKTCESLWFVYLETGGHAAKWLGLPIKET